MDEVNNLSDTEIVDYISESASLIDSLKSELTKVSSENKDLRLKLEEAIKTNNALMEKQASIKETTFASSKDIYNVETDQADLIAENLIQLGFIKSASLSEISKAIQEHPSYLANIVNTVLDKYASSSFSSQGRAVSSEDKSFTRQELSEEELMERKILFGE